MQTFIMRTPDNLKVGEGAVSSEGACVLFWLVEFEHISIWPDVETMLQMHQFTLEWAE